MSATYPRGIFEQDLPETLKELCDLMPLDKVIALCRKYGGTRLILPRKLFPGYSLPGVVGREAAEQLIQARGGTVLYVAKLDFALRVKRNLDIVTRYTAGERIPDLAREYNLSYRQVERIVKTPEPERDESQLTLF